ncbi:hypothetical protein AJ78_01956 [Emergomyces pasteurianus Ep9510]|uniref:DEUBAD domain-containing protein n=1 Tax=Emergomyces pasteurianus Ep9510 TaxID=1447872 RepID=A0A1J9QP90_9EURO|nr:hypothetical protein AJ78_01956 [Emergomyces pasteurianus Ep9510]
MVRPRGRPRKQKADNSGKTQPRQTTLEPRTPRRSSGAAEPPYDAANTNLKSKTVAKPPKMTSQAGVTKSTGARRGPSRTSKKDPWSEEQLTTSTESRIIDIDLVKLLASPKAWNCLDEDEKKEIMALLPDDIQRHADPGPSSEHQEDAKKFVIPPLPASFVRYSNNWRDAVRQFQLDLQMGRYDPEWQRQAAKAMEERAQGKFDHFKEVQFEEFWGQKQKLNHDVIAGESSKVKLATLVQDGVVRVGDVWRYSRVFRKGNEKFLLEKEVRVGRFLFVLLIRLATSLLINERCFPQVVDRDGSALTFAIPPGQRVFLYNTPQLTNDEEAPIIPSQDLQAYATNIEASGVNNGISSHYKVSQENKADTDAAPVIGSAVSTTPENPPVDNSVANGHADRTVDARPMVPNDKFATEAIQSMAPTGTHPPLQYSAATAKSKLPKVDNLECNRGSDEVVAADFDPELSSEQDVSHPPNWANDKTTPPATDATCAGAAGTEDVLVETALHETPDHDCSSRLPSDAPRAVSYGVLTKPNTQAMANGAHPNCNKESALTSTQLFKSGMVKYNATEAEITSMAPANARSDAEAEHASESASAAIPVSKSEQPRESIPRDIIFGGVTGPARLANKILEIDGRITEPPHGNAWKEFRCYRDNQDMGSLWECRQTWFVRRK